MARQLSPCHIARLLDYSLARTSNMRVSIPQKPFGYVHHVFVSVDVRLWVMVIEAEGKSR